jgi:elongation factor Ts
METRKKLVRAVKEFRERTGLGLQLSKQCVEATDLNVDAAVELARKEGLLTYSVRPATILAHGTVASCISEDKSRGALVELLCYTDFAAKTEEFQEAARLIALGLVVKAPQENIDQIISALEGKIKEPVRLHRYEVFDMRD